jgi:predicted small secreted protein
MAALLRFSQNKINFRRQLMKKTVVLGLLVIVLTFGFTGCDTGNGNGDNEFTVTFDLDGGNISGNTASIPIKVKSGEVITNLPAPQKSNNDFGGWFTQRNGNGTQFGSSTTVSSNLIVFAKWSSVVIFPFEGTWKGWNTGGENEKIWQFIGNDFIVIIANKNNAKGTFAYTETIITFTATHAWDGTEWLSWSEAFGGDDVYVFPEIEYSINGNELYLEGEGNGQPFIKQN